MLIKIPLCNIDGIINGKKYGKQYEGFSKKKN